MHCTFAHKTTTQVATTATTTYDDVKLGISHWLEFEMLTTSKASYYKASDFRKSTFQ